MLTAFFLIGKQLSVCVFCNAFCNASGNYNHTVAVGNNYITRENRNAADSYRNILRVKLASRLVHFLGNKITPYRNLLHNHFVCIPDTAAVCHKAFYTGNLCAKCIFRAHQPHINTGHIKGNEIAFLQFVHPRIDADISIIPVRPLGIFVPCHFRVRPYIGQIPCSPCNSHSLCTVQRTYFVIHGAVMMISHPVHAVSHVRHAKRLK